MVSFHPNWPAANFGYSWNVEMDIKKGDFTMEKVALVTGSAGNGIGRSTALTLAKDGYSIIINYRSNESSAESICSYINKNGGKASPVKADVFKEDDCNYLLEETLRLYHRVDSCIIGPGAGWNPEKPVNLKPQNSLSDVLKEIKPIYYLLPKVIKKMENTGGCIIGIASNPDLPSPAYSYNVAKNSRIDAFLGLVNSCWQKRIRVNIVAPGPVDHYNSLESAIHSFKNKDHSKITPQDIAETISFLCSENGSFITGNVIKYSF